MAERLTLDKVKELGAGRPAPGAVVDLYRQAFRDFGVRSLWSRCGHWPSSPDISGAMIE